MIRQVKSGDDILAIHLSGEWESGLHFYSAEEDFVQVGTWHYDAGKKLDAHKHNPVARTITHTQEVIYIKQGALKASIYDIDGRFLECIEAHQGNVLILLNGGHDYEIMEDATQVLEVKNGPFVGSEADKTRL